MGEKFEIYDRIVRKWRPIMDLIGNEYPSYEDILNDFMNKKINIYI